ncbi:MAG: D-alanine--D-alanine ligase family protein [Escherichia coli]|nr:D-alanine--D-alanine ligase family protein [Escherichia coli]
MEKLRVGIVFGGKSAEHEVSLQSAKNIVDAIDKSRFDVVLLGIDKQGQWHVSDASNYLLNADDPAHIALRPSATSLAQVPGKHEHQLIDAQNGQPLPTVDVIFPIVHGTLGEDGSLQGMLRVANLPFVGSDVLASAACMDKDVTKRLLRDAGLNIAPFITLTRANRHNISFAEVESKLGLPLFVKPANQGSSVGVSKVTSEEQYAIAVDLAFEFDHKVIVEFYAYDTKYIDEDGAKVVVPAAIAPEINDKIRAIAVQAYQTLGCAGMARVDVFLTPENEVVINEINTLPGFTNISMYPKLWQASGLGYTDLITRLIELALERHAADNALKTTM